MANINKGFKGKKGQVTIFIILGILLLLATAIIVYLNVIGEGTTIKEQIPQEEKLPGELDSVRVAVKKCLHETTKDGLEELGMQAGWVSTRDEKLAGREFNFVPDDTNSDGMAMKNLQVPYWTFMDDDNYCQKDCMFGFQRPPLKSSENEGDKRPDDDTSIEAQLDRYIKKEMPACLDEAYENFRPRFEIQEKSPLKPTTVVTPKEVLVKLDYIVQVSDSSVKAEVKGAYTRIDLPLKKIYELARGISEAESEYRFIERNIMNMITVYSGVDRDKLPPISATRTDVGSMVVWSETEVKNKVKQEILVPFVQGMQVPGTLNYRKTEYNQSGSTLDRMAQGMIASFSSRIVNESYGEYETNFNYLDSPVYFEVTPSKGEILRPQKMSGDIGGVMGVFVQNYEFRYDVTFPVLVTIVYPGADEFEDSEYIFQFAVEANIRNNMPFGPGDEIPELPETEE